MFGIGPGHGLLAQQSQVHSTQTGEASVKCQSICPPLMNAAKKIQQVMEDDAEPDPVPFWQLQIQQFATVIYMAALSVLAFKLLLRRPPDLVLQYSNWRI